MSALEQEIIDKFHLLDKDAQQHILNLLTTEATALKPMTWDEWLAWARDFREKTAAEHGEDFVFNSVDALNEAREERLNDLMGSE